MRQFIVKNLRKSIENLNKRIDELEAGDLDILKELFLALEFLLEEVGDPTPAIDKYNEIISFLDLIENTSKLKSLLDDIRNSIPEAPVQSDWAEDNVNDQAYIKNKPNLSDVATSGSYNDLSDKPDLSNVATSGSYEDLSNKPHIPEDPVLSDWAENDTTDQAYIKNKPNLASVATSGDYTDLSNKPTIPAALIQSDWAQNDNTLVDYIKNKPDLSNFVTKSTAESIQYDTNSHAYVDLGLPSGILWATMNVGASNSTDVGLYFQWGDTNGYTSDQVGSEQGLKLFDSHWSDYALTEKYKTTDKQILDAEDDAVSSIWGGAWRMPTKEEFEELFDSSNTTKSFVTIDNVAGIKFTSNRPGYTDKYVFFPVTGFPIDGHFLVGNSEEGFYWSSSLKTQDNDTLRASEMWFATQSSTSDVEYAPRNFAAAIRGVFEGLAKISKVATTGDYNDLNNKPDLSTVATTGSYNDLTDKPTIPTKVSDLTNNLDFLKNPHLSNGHEYVEIAGIKWATMNIGATSTTDKGLFFAWGETVGYPYNTNSDAKSFSLSDYKYAEFDGSDYIYTKYNDTDQKTQLDLEDDPARVNWGGNWRMPTHSEFLALINACTVKLVHDNGVVSTDMQPSDVHVVGFLFIDKTDYTKTIYFPCCLFEKDGRGPISQDDGSNMFTIWLNNVSTETHKASNTVGTLTYTNDNWNGYMGAGSRPDFVYAGRAVRPILDEQSTPSTVAEVAITGDYNDLVNKPEIIRVVEITGNLSNQTTSITGILNDGKKETVIYINNTENTYYVTVSNSYKTLRNTQLSLVACPGGYCEVSYINKGGIIFAKGLVMGVRQSDSNSKYILATYDVTNTNTATPLIYSEALSAYADMEIDGALLPSPVASYTFDTVGEHTVKFILPDLEQFDEQNGIKFGWMNIGNKLKSIVLPEGITTIPDYSFIACQSLESVTLPSTIKTIGNSAFGSYWNGSGNSGTYIGCDKLSSINIPNGVTSIGYGCFAGCTSLTSITIPNSVTSLEHASFSRCTNLTTVSLGTGLTVLRHEMFTGCTSLTDVTIPNTITSILQSVFCGCSSLQTIVIPDSVTNFGGTYSYQHDYEGVFANCTSLTNVTLGNNIVSLKGHDFYNCTSLQTLNIPDKLQYLNPTAFKGCSSLTAFNVSNNNANLSSIDGVIYNKDATKLVKYPTAKQGTFTVPSTVTRLDDGNRHKNPFAYCNGVTTVEIGQNVSIIYPYNFSGCSSLTTITIDPNNQTYSSIDGILYNKNATKLIRCPEGKQSVTIPNTVTELGDHAFINCANITDVNIPNSVTTIGYSSFDECTNLSSITIPSSVTSIENCNNFANCTSLPVINGIRYADTFAVKAVEERNEYTIQSGTRFIGDAAFKSRENLQSITIPSTVVAMGDYVFDNCDKLTTITFEGTTAPSVFSDTFRGVKSSGGTIRVPANSTGYDVIMQKNGLSNWTKVEY